MRIPSAALYPFPFSFDVRLFLPLASWIGRTAAE